MTSSAPGRQHFPIAGLAMMIAEVSPGATIRRVRRIGGGLATQTFAIDTTRGDLVVKIYDPQDHRAPLEWERLKFAQRASVPVPAPVALDTGGRWFGTPALAMSRLPGRANVKPTDVDRWLRQIALALIGIHETDTSGADGPLLQPLGIAKWVPPSAKPSALLSRSIDAVQRYLPSLDGHQLSLLHGDFHPGNLVWRRNTLSGVVDWSMARLGPRWYEVAYCRADIALLLGVPAAKRMARHYMDISGSTPIDLPVFDLMCGLAARQHGSRWLHAYRQQGRTDTPRQFAARVTPFLRQALAELGA